MSTETCEIQRVQFRRFKEHKTLNILYFSNSSYLFQGSYIHIPHDHIAYRYEILKVIGKGSFGQVLKVYDHKTHQHVALKMVRNEKRFHRQAQEEIRILEHLRKQDKDNSCNIIHMLDNFTFRWVQCSFI